MTVESGTARTMRMRAVPGARLATLPQVQRLDPAVRRDIRVVSSVLPFKVNNYVLDELIDWDRAPDDPLYRLTFPDRGMLPQPVFDEIAALIDRDAGREELRAAVNQARLSLNPHPGDQLQANVPQGENGALNGLQHKYRETVLVFPGQGQTCHAYCGYCFRWAQFIGVAELKQAVSGPEQALGYLSGHPEVSDVLFTGGDPMIMSTERLRAYVTPLLEPRFEHIRNIRFGTKALSYWPYRFTTDDDADELLRLLERATSLGRHVAVMAHFSHYNELETEACREAIRRIRDTGAVIRAQAPLVRHVNDDPAVWARMWRTMTNLGVVPYYMFVERDTGASQYFELPLRRAVSVYRDAISAVSGLERTARGPVMSASPGKVVLDGTARIAGQDVFCCRFLQARDPDWVGRPFFAKLDEHAVWFDDLKPAFDEPWFWQAEG
ncbi:KamA family radical SAM protein [Streptomyces rubradiris]|uniref:KamA family radical SAM protein n=1 Tax=Streptomyces rubradiris TaxID=285531 RepID=A0ABQ3R827_STRRR|nr:lysine 2,3-aminomutase [Streptomyces rubradiris]GHH24502.1 KamA family radical SAM protein [Streptomyces rubradiris]GHI52001.1 KamA family radical SAM protein [Streptomyces rubradiris]